MSETPTAPHSIEAEQSVLGALLLDNGALARVSDKLGASDFFVPEHRLIFEAAAALIGERRPADVTTISARLESSGTLESVGGLDYLGTLVQNVPTAANVRHYADIVHSRALARRLATAGEKLRELALVPGANAADIAADFRAILDDIKAEGARKPLVIGPAKAAVGDLRRVEYPAPRFLIERILPVAVARVVGSGKLGKSTLLLHMAAHVVLGRAWLGHRVERPGAVLFVTAEDSREDMLYRSQHMARAAGFDDDEIATLEEALYFEDWSGEEAGRIAEPDANGGIRESAAVDDLLRKYEGAGVTLVILDPLSLLGPGERFVNDGEIACARIARKISRALDCAVLIVHHVSQNVARAGITDQHAGRGGTAGADNSRAVWQISGPPADKRPPEVERALADGSDVLYVHVHAVSYGPPVRDPIVVERTGWHFAPLAVSEAAGPPTPEQVEARDAEAVLAALRPGIEYGREEVFDVGIGGVSRDRTRKAIAWLVREGRLIHEERRTPGSAGRARGVWRLSPSQGRLDA
jgi:hypothetical protein